MIICPNCTHQNPEGATQCEACYTPLPTTTSCPHCGATVQTDAAFCGQCGSNLQPSAHPDAMESITAAAVIPTVVSTPPDVVPTTGIGQPELVASGSINLNKPAPSSPDNPDVLLPSGGSEASYMPPTSAAGIASAVPLATATSSSGSPASSPATQLQQLSARLVHVQTQVMADFPQNVSVVHIGKPNDLVPPDIDVSGFPHSEIVSRIHADIRVEGDAYYIEDVGSANGTYINNIPLPKGNRHRLRPGDRISLGKGDLVSFIFQIS